MQLLFLKSKWEAPHLPIGVFLERVKDDGFDGAELFLPTLHEEPDTLRGLLTAHGLELALSIATEGATPEEHLADLERGFDRAAEYRPLLVNGHVGRDIFPFDDNLRIFRAAMRLSEGHGIPFVAETHRRRPTYSAVETRKYLEALPQLRLNADFSHWMVVHESDLHDQPDTVDLAIRRSRHIHARIGYEEGPQVNDPRAPEWGAHLRTHLRCWRDIVDHCRREGAPRLTITPEFGPPPYQHTLPYTRQQVADPWELNVAMRDRLLLELA